MAEVMITVRGEAQSRPAPERATVRLSVEFEGQAKDGAVAAATDAASALGRQLEALHGDDGPVTRWNSGQVRVWSQPAWKEGGPQQPATVHHASIEFTARFSDFEAMALWLDDVLPMPGVNVAGIDWSLTRAREQAVLAQARAEAVRDAQQKAAAYARSLNLGEPRPVAVADAGMLDGTGGNGVPQPMFAMAASAGRGGPEVSLTPDEITVHCAVDARFAAAG